LISSLDRYEGIAAGSIDFLILDIYCSIRDYQIRQHE